MSTPTRVACACAVTTMPLSALTGAGEAAYAPREAQAIEMHRRIRMNTVYAPRALS
jgi:hypothetical protein